METDLCIDHAGVHATVLVILKRIVGERLRFRDAVGTGGRAGSGAAGIRARVHRSSSRRGRRTPLRTARARRLSDDTGEVGPLARGILEIAREDAHTCGIGSAAT